MLQVQQVCIVELVTGCSFPPLRLDVIKNVNTPACSAEYGCQDQDCQERHPCKGNRLEISPALDDDDGEEELRIFLVHGKNDRRRARSNYQVDFAYPKGDALDLLLVHIREGRALLTLEKADDEVPGRLFVTHEMNAFTDATFVHYWASTMRTAPAGLKYFPPSQARTIFVEEYTREGSSAEFWEGAAIIMGNTVNQWKQSYNPSRKRRMAEGAVMDMHRRHTANS